MARDLDDDYAPRPRRRRRFEDEYDDDYAYERPPQRSGWVIAVAVLNLVLGSILTLAGLFTCFIGFIILATVDRRGDREGSIAAIIISFLGLLLGAGYVLGGFGLLNRRNWGRIITLILAAFNFLACAAGILGIVGVIAERGGRPENKIVGLIFLFFGVLLNLGYGLFVYMTLLRRSIAEEFR